MSRRQHKHLRTYNLLYWSSCVWDQVTVSHFLFYFNNISLVFCIHFHFPWKIICECFQLSSHLLPVPLLSSVNILSQSTPCPCSILPIGYMLLQYVFPVRLQVWFSFFIDSRYFFYIVSVKQNSLLVCPSCFSASHTASPDIIRYVSSLIALCILSSGDSAVNN